MELVKQSSDGNITGYRVKNFQYTSLGMIILHRLLNNRDIKIIITSKGNTTGTGKTMLAIILSRVISQYAGEIFGYEADWSAEKYSFMDVYEYLENYEAYEGRVLITDEMEYLADNRRSMSDENLHFSQAWQMLRYKNNISIGTAPSFSNLDKRIPENTDIWINVQVPGVANVYYVTMHDFTHEIIYQRIKQRGYNERLLWDAIDNDPDYEYLTEQKSNVGVPGLDQEDEISKEDLNDAKRNIRDTYIENLLELKERKNLKIYGEELTQGKIADLAECSQQHVSKVARGVA